MVQFLSTSCVLVTALLALCRWYKVITSRDSSRFLTHARDIHISRSIQRVEHLVNISMTSVPISLFILLAGESWNLNVFWNEWEYIVTTTINSFVVSCCMFTIIKVIEISFNKIDKNYGYTTNSSNKMIILFKLCLAASCLTRFLLITFHMLRYFTKTPDFILDTQTNFKIPSKLSVFLQMIHFIHIGKICEQLIMLILLLMIVHYHLNKLRNLIANYNDNGSMNINNISAAIIATLKLKQATKKTFKFSLMCLTCLLFDCTGHCLSTVYYLCLRSLSNCSIDVNSESSDDDIYFDNRDEFNMYYKKTIRPYHEYCVNSDFVNFIVIQITFMFSLRFINQRKIHKNSQIHVKNLNQVNVCNNMHPKEKMIENNDTVSAPSRQYGSLISTTNFNQSFETIETFKTCSKQNVDSSPMAPTIETSSIIKGMDSILLAYANNNNTSNSASTEIDEFN